MSEEKETIGGIIWITVQGWLTCLGMFSLVVEYGVTRIPFTYEMAMGYAFVFTGVALICGALNTIPWFNNLNYRKVEKC